MIKFKKAPAGYIAQFFTDDRRPYPGAPNQEFLDHHYMDVTGEWCPTLEEAIESVKKQRPKEVKKLQKKLAKLEAQVVEHKALIRDLETSSDAVEKDETS